MPTPPILRTKITPPRRPRRTLARPRLLQLLDEAYQYRLTLLQAGAGYGKSTALASFGETQRPVIWYQATAEDADPFVFLLHLCHATRLALPEIQGLPLPALEAWDFSRGTLPSQDIVSQYLNAVSETLTSPVILVLDDVHLIVESPEIAHILNRLIGLAPPDLHFLLAGRPPIRLPNLARWRARDQVLNLDQTALRFTPEEIAGLFRVTYQYELTDDEVAHLVQTTEGWAVTLQLIWQSIRSGASGSVQDALIHSADSLDSLFHILAQEVFGQQPADVQHFMRVSATLRVMTAADCDALRGTRDSAGMMSYMSRQELFVVDLGDGALRYHHIFHRFLREITPKEEQHRWHRQAADHFRKGNNLDAAIYHALRGGDHDRAAELLAQYGKRLLASGRLDTLAAYLDALPPETLHQRPTLLATLGDLARLHSRFQEALGWYQQAESLWRERGQSDGVVRAFRGQARVYLDTVNPSRAEELLQQALRLSDGTADREAQARLYELLAENKLNAGKPQEAEQLRQQSQTLLEEGPHDSELLFRVLMRTGRLESARQKLETRAREELAAPVQTPRAHRETQLLLSIIYAFQGEAEAAYQAAAEGTRRGITLDSPFVIAVGHMRQGHALMLLPGEGRYAQAQEQFEKTIDFSQSLAIPRLRVEAYWGLSRVFGYRGQLLQAQELAQQGLEIADQAGDEWIASLIRLTVGASLTLASRYEAASGWLNLARRGFTECSDPFGQTATQLWQCVSWYHQKNYDLLAPSLSEVLTNSQQYGYDFLLTKTTLLGPPDPRLLVPLLILARNKGWARGYANQLLTNIGLPQIKAHPGYQLRAYTLGGFQVWRGQTQIPATGWRREKTRQLFQLLLTYRHSPLDRYQILDYLWPEADPDIALRNFKVAISTLYNTLEPDRVAGSDSAFIVREGKVYGLRPGADLWLDAEVFLQAVAQAEPFVKTKPDQARSLLEEALALYKGNFLSEARYEPWLAEEREHLAVVFLRAADLLTDLYLANNQPQEAIALSRRILAQDNCWERAYRHLMRAYQQIGDQGQLARTYQRCIQTLQDELEVEPSPQTVTLYYELTEDQRNG